jgi:hypothetical protein
MGTVGLVTPPRSHPPLEGAAETRPPDVDLGPANGAEICRVRDCPSDSGIPLRRCSRRDPPFGQTLTSPCRRIPAFGMDSAD